MIGHLRGTITWLGDSACVIDVAGVGYRVLIGKTTRALLHIGDTTTLFTHLQVKEDALDLVGFVEEQEYTLFTILILASGVGSKVALSVLDTLGVGAASRAIATKDVVTISRVPGIGKKTAEKMCVELADKIPDIFIGSEHSPLIHDIIDALVAMGYSEYQAQKVAHNLDEIVSLESGLARALQALSK